MKQHQTTDFNQFSSQIESLFDELIIQQNKKMLERARYHVPHITFEDALNPNDYPVLLADPVFNYEEGIAAGLLAAQIALRARVLRPLKNRDDSIHDSK